ncbi:l-rhamnose isomerase [Anaerotruncus sp. CAG:390]|nr:l-rhamnose isomerase [Anaerotruncus sp. CAG:390]
MHNKMIYEAARERYAALGIDTEKAISTLLATPISMHCWQGDDVRGFEGATALDGGIQATGNYPGAARTPAELMQDIDRALSLVPGKHRLNIHANYAVFENGEHADRDALLPRHFAAWVRFAKERGLGLDFNPTFFSHPMAASGLTLSSPDDNVREFWIRHGIACLRISEYFARETGKKCLMNIWIPDGYKDTPADRQGPRRRFAESLDRILGAGYDRDLVAVSLESKVFGIGVESYTVGSAEFCLEYSAKHGLVPLMDNGHYHPTEVVSDKIPSMLLFADNIALHVTRGVRWDSDHVVLFDDETREIAKEVVRCNALDRTFLALDYFDASINRIAAWVIGMRNLEKALLNALLTPHEQLRALQDAGRFTELLAAHEELKTLPMGAVWEELCTRAGVPADGSWMDAVKQYEKDVFPTRS